MGKGGGMVARAEGGGLVPSCHQSVLEEQQRWVAGQQLDALRHWKATMPAVVPAPEREDCPGCGAPTAADGGCDYCGRA